MHAPRKRSQKKRAFIPHVGPLLDAAGRLLMYRFRGWSVTDVAKVDAKWLVKISSYDCATPEDKKAIRRALITTRARPVG